MSAFAFGAASEVLFGAAWALLLAISTAWATLTHQSETET